MSRLIPFVVFGFCVLQATQLLSQSPSYQNVVQTSVMGNKAFLEMNMLNLQQSLDTVFARLGSAGSSGSTQSWSDVLGNGSNPGMDINFHSFDVFGLGGLTSTGTLSADSLMLGKDAEITGSLAVTDVVSFGDSLSVTGYVAFSDSLEVVRAVTIGETIFVTGVTSLGDSLHVAGNVDFDALLNADGPATFGSTLTVSGVTTLNDSLQVNSGMVIEGTLYADSMAAAAVINGQVSSLGNHDADDLAEGSTHLYLTPSERASLTSLTTMMHVIDSLSCTWTKYQGHVYELILIGEQCWFAENLRSEHYANGDAISGNLSDGDWSSTLSGAQSIYGEGLSPVSGSSDEVANLATYGRLYNWYAVDDLRGLCPSGWHVPTDDEWTVLIDELGGSSGAGAALKSSPSDSPSWDGTNTSGFSALPGGWRGDSDAYFLFEGYSSNWWSASPSGESFAWLRKLNSDDDNVSRNNYGQRYGFSVRCLRVE